MTGLAAAFQEPRRREAIVRDAAALLRREVASKRGLRGAALKAGFRAFQTLRPGIVDAALRRLLPLFIEAVQPHWTEAKHDRDPRQFFVSRKDVVAESMLSVTDTLSLRAKNRAMIRIYRSLRGQAVQHVQDAVPALADLLSKHDPGSEATYNSSPTP